MLRDNSQLLDFIRERISEFDLIEPRRKQTLGLISELILPAALAGRNISFLFVCSDNSIRTQLCHIWIKAAAQYFSIQNLRFYSGGVSVKGIPQPLINTLKTAGFKVKVLTKTSNPHLAIKISKEQNLGVFYSKYINVKENPKENFCAIITCQDVERELNLNMRTYLKVTIPYDSLEGLPEANEQKAYDLLSKKIAREMLYIMTTAHEILLETLDEEE
ncbi:hypothetical protein [Chondrinema litorale]|uniref:hypothetical protein n=1 Tax=Chondrinema litorale TaxID=2994555 RepID=UPI0025434132|nr:hypothetical protein [Chondrinema litorale]UZR93650.1 hypothetical protein OQ292_17515 [Chondrinema litorale]